MEVPQPLHGGAELSAGRGVLCPGSSSSGTTAAEPSPKPPASHIPAVGYNLKGPRGSKARIPQCWLAAGGQHSRTRPGVFRAQLGVTAAGARGWRVAGKVRAALALAGSWAAAGLPAQRSVDPCVVSS